MEPTEASASPPEPERVVSRARIYAALALAVLAATGLVAAWSRPPLDPWPTIAALFAQTLLLFGAAATMRGAQNGVRLVVRGALLSLVGLLTAPSALFWGPNGPFAALVVLVLLFTGVLSEPGARGRIGVAVYVTLAIGQALPVVLVLGGSLPDHSVVPLLLPGHPSWHHAAGHLAIQGAYLASYLAGRALQRRYAEVAREMQSAVRATSLSEALIEEARAEYRRAVAATRARVGERLVRASQPPPSARRVEDTSPDTRAKGPPEGEGRTPSRADPAEPTPSGSGRASTPPSSPGATSIAPPPPEASDAWRAAYQSRARLEQGLVIAMGIVGAGLLGVVGPGPVPVAVGCLGILAIALLTTYARRSHALRPWAWFAAGALSALPAYAVGLHSGFACVIALLLFLRSAFDAREGAESALTRGAATYGALVGCALAHTIVLAAIVTGAIPDAGNAPVLQAAQRPFEPYAMHALVLGLYGGALATGHAIDVRYRALAADARNAAREAVVREAQLRTAKADLARAVAANEALFTGASIGGYRLERMLASGGMGEVYEAVHEGDPAAPRVAVKLLRRERAGEALSLTLFEDEATVLSRVDSPYVAKVLAVSPPEAELPYLVMELIDGASLATMLRARQKLSEGEVRGLVRDVAEGLRAVHAAGIVHRDVKPHNVMLTTSREGARWKIVDFGVAQLSDLVSASAAVAAGTPTYMAPEQALSERVDARADLYALALVAYRALTGRPAFVGEDAVQIAMAARAAGPPDPKIWLALTPDLERVLRIGLAAHAEDRFKTAGEMKRSFEAAFDEKLDPKMRARADRLLEREPWSQPRTVAESDARTRPSITGRPKRSEEPGAPRS
ncbi:MAG: protein kinase [Sandaracinus sp.]